jgi:hypothetical protein
MDRRYREAQFSDGAPAGNSAQRRSEGLVNRDLQAARVGNRQAAAYGGSTGQPDGGAPRGLVNSVRGKSYREAQQIFQEVGSGDVGGGGGFKASRNWKAEGWGTKPDSVNLT